MQTQVSLAAVLLLTFAVVHCAPLTNQECRGYTSRIKKKMDTFHHAFARIKDDLDTKVAFNLRSRILKARSYIRDTLKEGYQVAIDYKCKHSSTHYLKIYVNKLDTALVAMEYVLSGEAGKAHKNEQKNRVSSVNSKLSSVKRKLSEAKQALSKTTGLDHEYATFIRAELERKGKEIAAISHGLNRGDVSAAKLDKISSLLDKYEKIMQTHSQMIKTKAHQGDLKKVLDRLGGKMTACRNNLHRLRTELTSKHAAKLDVGTLYELSREITRTRKNFESHVVKVYNRYRGSLHGHHDQIKQQLQRAMTEVTNTNVAVSYIGQKLKKELSSGKPNRYASLRRFWKRSIDDEENENIVDGDTFPLHS